MLKKNRITLAAVFFIGITLLFIGIGAKWWGWMASLQFLPSCLALNFGVIALILLITLLFGRIYCSVICPMGVYQDIVIKLRSLLGSKKGRKKRERRFHYLKEAKWVRYTVLVLFIACIIAGLQAFVAILAPYSAYGRMVHTIVNPQKGLIVTAILTFVIITALAWMYGRWYCNSICPVGTTLSFFSRFAMFRPVIDTDKCKNCKACEKGCKSSCINIAEHKIDYSRCVDCFDCTGNCKFDALHYQFAWGHGRSSDSSAAPQNGRKAGPQEDKKGADQGRRAFMIGAALAAGTATSLKAQQAAVEGGLAPVIPKQVPQRKERLVPFGSGSLKNFYSHCTACQLCVSNCPNKVLRPSTDFEHFMQPEMSYEKGYCRPECTLCSQLCPAGAIRAITPEEKTTISIGHASVNYDLCIMSTEGVSCGNCARHCPAGAVMMVLKDPDNPGAGRVPAVNEELCIGCGACENLCPSRPISAITVSGLQNHITH